MVKMYEDKTLKCKDCGADFIFESGEQQFYAEKGFDNEPTRCRDCRNAKKTARKNREMFTVTCAGCGGEATVPFKPTNDKPVYCSDCFANQK